MFNSPLTRTVSIIVILMLLLGTIGVALHAGMTLAGGTSSRAQIYKPPVWAAGGPIDYVRSMDVAAGGSVLVGTNENNMTVYDLKTGIKNTIILNSDLNNDITRVLDVDDDGKYAIAADDSNWIFLVALTNGTVLFKEKLNASTNTGAISGNGRYFAIGTGESNAQNYLTVYENTYAVTGRGQSRAVTKQAWNTTFMNLITGIDMSNDGTKLVAGSWDKNLKVFSTTNSTPIWVFNSEDYATFFFSVNKITDVDMTPDGTKIALGMESGVATFNFTDQDPNFYWGTDKNRTESVAISDDGQTVAAGGTYLWILDRASNDLTWVYKFQDGTIPLVSISSSGQKIAAAALTDAFYGVVLVFDKASSSPDWMHLYKYPINRLSMTSDGKYIGVISSAVPTFAVYDTTAITASPYDDKDADNLPDWWEANNSLDRSIDDAFFDADNDQFTNLQEYLAQSDPQDATDFPGKVDDNTKHLTTSAVKRSYRDPFGDVRSFKASSDPQDLEYESADITKFREVDILNLTSARVKDDIVVSMELAKPPAISKLKDAVSALSSGPADAPQEPENNTGNQSDIGTGNATNTTSRADLANNSLNNSLMHYAVYFIDSNFTENWDPSTFSTVYAPDKFIGSSSFYYSVSGKDVSASGGTAHSTTELVKNSIVWNIPLAEAVFLPADFEVFGLAWFSTADPNSLSSSNEPLELVYDSAGHNSLALEADKLPERGYHMDMDDNDVDVTFSGTGYLQIKDIDENDAPEDPEDANSIGIFLEIDLMNGTLGNAEIRVTYSDDDLGDEDESTLTMYYHDPATHVWFKIEDSGVDADTNTVWANVDHFTIFAPMAEASGPTDTGGDDGLDMPSFLGLSIIIWIAIALILILVFGVTGMIYRKKREGPQIARSAWPEDKDDFEVYDAEFEADTPPGKPGPGRPIPKPPIPPPPPGTPRPKKYGYKGRKTPPPPPPPPSDKKKKDDKRKPKRHEEEDEADEDSMSWEDDEDVLDETAVDEDVEEDLVEDADAKAKPAGGMVWEDDDDEDEDDELDTMPCPKCGASITITSKERPITIECDECGAKGKLKK